MATIARSTYLDSEFGVLTELESAGSSLENPYVYDAVAREIKSMAREGLVEITREHTRPDASEPLIDRISFVRVR
jgi:hypothetical protein